MYSSLLHLFIPCVLLRGLPPHLLPRRRPRLLPRRFSSLTLLFTSAIGQDFDFNGELDVEAMERQRTFPIPPNELINLARRVLAMEFGTNCESRGLKGKYAVTFFLSYFAPISFISRALSFSLLFYLCMNE